MKKTLSLLTSFLLITIMIFSVSVQASVPVKIQPVTKCIDMKNAESVSVPYITDSYFLDVDGKTTLKLTSTASRSIETFSDGTKALKIGRASGSSKYIYFTYVFKDENDISFKPTDGKFVFSLRFLSTDTLGSSRRCFRAIWTGGSSAGVAANIYDEGDPFLPNTWYDIVWTINLDTNSITLVSTPELSAASSAELESYTLTKTKTYNYADLSSVRADFQTTNVSGHYTYFADIQAVYYSGTTYNKASILDIGSSGEVDYNQNNIRIKLSDEIPNLKKEHISVKNAGEQDVAISSAAVSSDGTHYYVDVKTATPLPAWTQYNLEISADAWGRDSLQDDGSGNVPVTAIDGDFFTPAAPFDMKDPVFSMSEGKLKADATIINTTATPEDVTLAIVIYDADGRVKSVTTKSFDSFKALYPGEDKSITGDSFESGDTAKLIAVNGWSKMTSLFGKYWSVSYDELN